MDAERKTETSEGCMKYIYNCFWCKKEYETENMYGEVCSIACSRARRTRYGKLVQWTNKHISTRLYRAYCYIPDLMARKKCPDCNVNLHVIIKEMQLCTKCGKDWHVNESGMMVHLEV